MTGENIILVGYMGSGKSTVGKALASRIGYHFVDSDEVISEALSMSVSKIFSEKGETYFREFESSFVQHFHGKSQILAVGGGLPCFFDNMDVLSEKGLTIYLEMNAKELYERLQSERIDRPIISEKSDFELKEFIKTSLAQRTPYYERSKILIRVKNKSIDEIVDEILELVQ